MCIGLCLRGLGPALPSGKGHAVLDAEATQKMYVGLAALVFAALAYSLLGVIYQTLVSVGDNPPSHSEIMLQASLIGALPFKPPKPCKIARRLPLVFMLCLPPR